MSLDTLIAEAELGEEARKFKESDLYRCLIGIADQEVRLAQVALSKVDPTDVEAIRRLQNEVWRGEAFAQWIDELIARGTEALNQWRQEQHGSAN